MIRRRVTAAGLLLASGAAAWLAAQEPPPARPSGADVILTNGKVVTVDDRFSIAQAVAIEGDRILRVGSDSEIIRLSSPSTRRIDLRGRTVIPGLIDNHMHLVRAAATWQQEVRWDGVGTEEAGTRPAARAGEDDARRRMDLHPRWLDGGSVRRRQPALLARGARPGGAGASGVPPGVLLRRLREQSRDGRARHRRASRRSGWCATPRAGRPASSTRPGSARWRPGCRWRRAPELEASTRLMIRDLNKAGLTAFGSAGCEADILPVFQRLADAARS